MLASGEYWSLSPLPSVAPTVKNLPSMQETWVQSLGSEDLWEKETATHSSTFARILWTEATVHGIADSRTHLSN